MAVSLLLGLWLATVMVGAWPQLHRLLHQNSEDAQHQCLITQLNKSLVLAAPPAGFPLGLDQNGVELPRAPRPAALAAADYRLSPSRAPPSLRPAQPG